MKLEYAGQNENNGLYPKKFGVIFFQPLLLDSKHGARHKAKSLNDGIATFLS